MKYRLKKDLVPTGTVFDTVNQSPTKTERYGDWCELEIELDKDHTISINISLSDLKECPEWFEQVSQSPWKDLS